MKTTEQKFYFEGLFSRYDNVIGVIKDYLLMESNERGRPDLDQINDIVTR